MNKKYNFTKEDYENAAKVSFSIAGMCRYLKMRPVGGNYTTIRDKIKEYSINISHFTGKGWNAGLKIKKHKKPLEEILKKDVIYASIRLKNRLFNNGLKEKKCECCGMTEWNGKEIPLELHHKDGDKYNNELNNLMILCPNCHAQTDHYRGNNKTRYDELHEKDELTDLEKKSIYESIPKYKRIRASKEKIEKPKRFCKVCGKELTTKQTNYCSYECSHKAISKKPNLSEFAKKLEEYKKNKAKLGKYYGVSEAAIRKWIKQYGL